MKIEDFEIKIIDSLLLNEFSDIESFAIKHCNLKPDKLDQNYLSNYFSLHNGDTIYLPENENEAFIKMQKFEKLVLYLKDCKCIELVPQSLSADILPVSKINPENNRPQPYDSILEIIHRNRHNKIIVLDELQEFKDRNYETKKQSETKIELLKEKKIKLIDRILNRTNLIILLIIAIVIFILAYIKPLFKENKNIQNSKSKSQIIETKPDSTSN